MSIKGQFYRDTAEWTIQTAHLSTVSDIVAHPAYQRIIDLGPAAIPLIIEQLRTRPDHWFAALSKIIGEDYAISATTLSEAASLWVNWYDQEGHITYGDAAEFCTGSSQYMKGTFNQRMRAALNETVFEMPCPVCGLVVEVPDSGKLVGHKVSS